jgi:hypothetical protein
MGMQVYLLKPDLSRAFSKEEVQIPPPQKTHEEMFNIPGHKGNAN